MKVKVLYNFNDLQENKHRVKGEIFECSKERCDFLVEHKAVEVIEDNIFEGEKNIVEVKDGITTIKPKKKKNRK